MISFRIGRINIVRTMLNVFWDVAQKTHHPGAFQENKVSYLFLPSELYLNITHI